MSPSFEPVMRNPAKLSSGIAPLGQRRSSAGVRRVVDQGHSLAYDPVLHPVRNGGQSPSITISAEVADDSIAGSVCLENGHILAGLALRLTGCVSVHSVRISTLECS
jgi:hypothetical protein